MKEKAKSFEERIHNGVATRRKDPVTRFFRVMSSFGSLFFTGALSAAIYKIGDKKFARRFFIGNIVAKGSTHWIKEYFGRARPEDSVVETSSDSFPSGHTTAAFASAAILSSRFDKAEDYFYTLAGLTGLSRLYLGAHYLSDIVAGAFIGELWGRLFGERSKQS